MTTTTTLPRWDERSFTDWRRWFTSKYVQPWRDNITHTRERWRDLFTTPERKQRDNDHIMFVRMLLSPMTVESYDVVDGVEVNRRVADIRRFDR